MLNTDFFSLNTTQDHSQEAALLDRMNRERLMQPEQTLPERPSCLEQLVAGEDDQILRLNSSSIQLLNSALQEKNGQSEENEARLSDTFMSHSGIIGYVVLDRTQRKIGGAILVPKQLTLLLRAVSEDGFAWLKEVILEKTHSLLGEQVRRPRTGAHRLLSFFDDEYFLYHYPSLEPPTSELKDQIHKTEQDVLDHLHEWDGWVKQITQGANVEPARRFQLLLKAHEMN